MTDSRKVQLAAEMDATGVRKGTQEVKEAVRDMARDVQASGQSAAKGVEAIGAVADGAVTKMDRATGKFIAMLQRQTAAEQAAAEGGKNSAKYLEIRAQQLGVNVEAIRPYIAQLEAAKRAQDIASGSLNGMGISAKQTAAALRGVPAQFTDIITSLQGGQAPITVLLQQGGQLKDMFGGAGNAAKALGGYVLGLVNPFTVAAAAAGALAYVYTKGQDEGAAFRRTLILTGGAAGVAAGQLSDMAAAVSKLGGGTQGRAAEILNQMAASGAIGATNLTAFADAALKLERVGGPAAEETAKAFAALGDAPFAASVKLNQSTGAFTASVLRQIKALEDQGRTLEATKVAQEAYASAVGERAPQMAATLGLVERAWLGIKEETKKAGDALLNIGRQDTLTDQVNALAESVGRLRAAAAGNAVARPGEFFRALFGGPSLSEQATDLDRILQQIRTGQALGEKLAVDAGERARQAKLTADWEKESDKFLSNEQQRVLAIVRTRNEGLAAGRSEEEIRKRIAQIEQKFDTGVNLQQIKNLEAQRLEILKRGESEIQLLRARGAIGARDQIEAETEQVLKGLAIRRSAAEAELALVLKRVHTDKEEAQARGVLNQLDEEATTTRINGSRSVEVFLIKQRNAALDAIQAERELNGQEMTAAAQAKTAAIYSLTVAQQQYAEAIKEEGDQLALEATLMGYSSQERALRIKQFGIELDLKHKLAEIDANNSGLDETDRETLRSQARATAAQARAQATTRAFVDEWQRAADQINSSLTDALASGFENGGGYAQKLADSVKSIFSSLVLRPVISMVLGGTSANIGSLLGLATGSSATGGAQASGAGGLGQLVNLYQQGSALSKGYSAVTGYFGGGTAATGATNAALAESAAGTGLTGASSASGAGASSSALAGYAGWAALAAVAVNQAANDWEKGWTSAALSGAGKSVNTAVNPFADFFRKLGDWGVLSSKWTDVLSGDTLFSRAFGRQSPQVQAQGFEGSISSGAFSGNAFADILEKGGWFRSDKRYTNTAALSPDLGLFLDQASKSIFEQAKAFGKALGLPAEQLADVTTSIRVALGDDSAANKQAIVDSLASYGDALVSGFADQVEPLKLYGESIAQTFQRVGTALQSTNVVLMALGQSALDASIAGGQAAVDLQALFGGADGFGQAANTYLQNFYSDSERAAIATKQLGAEFATLGFDTLPATREAFRGLVDAQDLTSVAGRQAYATLLQLSPAFAQVVAATQGLGDASTQTAADIAAAAKAMADAGKKALADLAGTQADLTVQLLRSQGQGSQADSLKRQQDLAKLTDGVSSADAAAITAAYDYNQVLRDQITAVDAATAAQAAANAQIEQNTAAAQQQLAAVANERSGLEQRLLQAQGNTAALRERELAALDPSNRALLQQIYALEDQSTAADQAARALTALNGTMDQLGSTRFDLENQLLNLQGNTGEVARRTRERDLAQLTAGLGAADVDRVTAAYDLNNTLRQQVTDMQSAQQATAALAQAQAAAAQQAAQAADQIRQAWQSVADTIQNEVDRIRGLTAGSQASSFGGAQAAFAIATGQARAGDQTAARLLPTLSQTLLQLADAQATSLFELQRIRAQTTASLLGTNAVLASSYGLTLPQLAAGTNYVPADMVAQLHEGEAVQPRAYNPAAGGGGGSSQAQAAIIEQLQGLRDDNAAQARSLAALQSRTTKVLELWQNDGLPETRVVT